MTRKSINKNNALLYSSYNDSTRMQTEKKMDTHSYTKRLCPTVIKISATPTTFPLSLRHIYIVRMRVHLTQLIWGNLRAIKTTAKQDQTPLQTFVITIITLLVEWWTGEECGWWDFGDNLHFERKKICTLFFGLYLYIHSLSCRHKTTTIIRPQRKMLV